MMHHIVHSVHIYNRMLTMPVILAYSFQGLALQGMRAFAHDVLELQSVGRNKVDKKHNNNT